MKVTVFASHNGPHFQTIAEACRSGKIINVYPSLLPKYEGKGVYGSKVHKKVLYKKRNVSHG